MKKIKAKNYFPYPSQESFEDALNIIAEIRAENYFWTKKIWYVEQKIKKFANDDINREFYVRLRDKLDEKICNSHTIYIDLLMNITKITGIKKKITKKFILIGKKTQKHFGKNNLKKLIGKKIPERY